MSQHPITLGPSPVALAHRGGGAEAVENSPEAFQRVVDLGFTWIETDVRATVDGHAMVFHDADLGRMTDTTGAIASLPLAVVHRSRLPNGEHPMSLADALSRWPHCRFNIDVKADDTVRPFLRAVAAADAWHRVSAAAFSARRLNRLRTLGGPRLATSLSPPEVARLRLGLPTKSPAWAAQVPRSVGPVPVATPSFVRRAHSRGLQVHVWTINDRDTMRSLLDGGVDGIVSDHPSVLRDLLIARGAWS